MQRIQEREIQEREKQMILKQIEDLKAEERRQQEEKVWQTAVLMAEVEKVNQAASKAKHEKTEKARALDQ